jgi:hypothetical protein
MFGTFGKQRCEEKPLIVRKLDGSLIDVDLSRARSVEDVRKKLSVALAVDTQPNVGVKLLNAGRDICSETSLEDIDRDLGLSVVLVQGAPEWYPRDKYIHDDLEVLQMTRTHDECFAEFLNGSSCQVDVRLYENALREWGWQEVSQEGRSWAHPGEKPTGSGGWTDFMASLMTQRNAAKGLGAATGFVAGVTGHADLHTGNGGDFSTSFTIAQMAGLVVYGTIMIVRGLRT